MSAVELLMSACETFLVEVCFCEGEFGLKELSADWGHSGKLELFKSEENV